MAPVITDVGLAHLVGLNRIENLEIQGTSITDAGLPHLAVLKSLRKLDLRATHVTPGGIAKLKAVLPGIDIEGP